jgi:hypothetical protein
LPWFVVWLGFGLFFGCGGCDKQMQLPFDWNAGFWEKRGMFVAVPQVSLGENASGTRTTQNRAKMPKTRTTWPR